MVVRPCQTVTLYEEGFIAGSCDGEADGNTYLHIQVTTGSIDTVTLYGYLQLRSPRDVDCCIDGQPSCSLPPPPSPLSPSPSPPPVPAPPQPSPPPPSPAPAPSPPVASPPPIDSPPPLPPPSPAPPLPPLVSEPLPAPCDSSLCRSTTATSGVLEILQQPCATTEKLSATSPAAVVRPCQVVYIVPRDGGSGPLNGSCDGTPDGYFYLYISITIGDIDTVTLYGWLQYDQDSDLACCNDGQPTCRLSPPPPPSPPSPPPPR
jgi:hypothetical protein